MANNDKYLKCVSTCWPAKLTAGKLYKWCYDADTEERFGSGDCVVDDEEDVIAVAAYDKCFVQATEQEVKRWKVEEALQLLKTEKIEVAVAVYGTYYNRKLDNGSWLGQQATLDSFLDKAYPIEAPEQKELRELEEQQRKIADRLAALRTKTDKDVVKITNPNQYFYCTIR